MRASSDFFVVGMTGLGTALFLTQLLIVSQQIVSAHNHVQAELAAEKSALPVTWVDGPRPLIIDEGGIPTWHPPPQPTQPPRRPGAVYPERALKDHIEGYVDFDLTVRPDGSVSNAKVVSEVPESYGFAAAAAKAILRWQFKSLSDTPITVRQRMMFKLH
jgi:protein TonB